MGRSLERVCFFFQAEDGIRDLTVTGVQTCALPILRPGGGQGRGADGGLPFGLSSHARVERSPPLRGDGSLTMPRIYIETYGCQMNVSDSELMLGVLAREGFVRTDDPAQADVLLVNTCAVRDHAEQKVLSRRSEE